LLADYRLPTEFRGLVQRCARELCVHARRAQQAFDAPAKSAAHDPLANLTFSERDNSGATAPDRIRDLILNAYAEHEARQTTDAAFRNTRKYELIDRNMLCIRRGRP